MSNHSPEAADMSSSELDREQIRRAIRNLDSDHIFYLLDEALSLLSQDQLCQLIAPYMNPEQFIVQSAPQEDLLAEVLAFQKASLAGEYYEEIRIGARNCEKNPRGTLCWIADLRRLLDRCAAVSSTTSAADVCQAFEILFGLLDSLDDGTGENILFAEEGGSWMVGVDWKRVLPAWFRALGATAEPADYAERIEAMIGRHCHGEQVQMLELAQSMDPSARRSTGRESVARPMVSRRPVG